MELIEQQAFTVLLDQPNPNLLLGNVQLAINVQLDQVHPLFALQELIKIKLNKEAALVAQLDFSVEQEQLLTFQALVLWGTIVQQEPLLEHQMLVQLVHIIHQLEEKL
jgi:hypothetical protein